MGTKDICGPMAECGSRMAQYFQLLTALVIPIRQPEAMIRAFRCSLREMAKPGCSNITTSSVEWNTPILKGSVAEDHISTMSAPTSIGLYHGKDRVISR